MTAMLCDLQTTRGSASLSFKKPSHNDDFNYTITVASVHSHFTNVCRCAADWDDWCID